LIAAVPPGHPKQTLLFFVVSDLDQTIRTEMRNFVYGLADARSWALGPPTFVRHREKPRDTSKGDVPVETVGGYLKIYTALPPWNLAREVDILHLLEVETLVTRLCDFSHRAGLEIEFELDGKFVGAIRNGAMDVTLSVGLLGEWRRHLSP